MYITVPVVKTPEDYQAALTRLEEIFHAHLSTPESDEADVLVIDLYNIKLLYFSHLNYDLISLIFAFERRI